MEKPLSLAESPKGLAVAGDGAVYDVGGQWRRRWFFVPANAFQVIPQELLVETRLRLAGRVAVSRPVAGRVRRQRLVDQDELTLQQAELELGVGQDQAAVAGMGFAGRVQPQTGVR